MYDIYIYIVSADSWVNNTFSLNKGNKGAVYARFYIKDTSFCFINSHFAAHREYVAKRNEDYQIILNHKGFVDMNSMIVMNNQYIYNYYNEGSENNPFSSNNNSNHSRLSLSPSSSIRNDVNNSLISKSSNNQQEFVLQVLKLNETLINLRKKIMGNEFSMPNTLLAITTNKQEGIT